MTEHNPAPSPSGHPLLSGPPTLTDIHQIFTIYSTPEIYLSIYLSYKTAFYVDEVAPRFRHAWGSSLISYPGNTRQQSGERKSTRATNLVNVTSIDVASLIAYSSPRLARARRLGRVLGRVLGCRRAAARSRHEGRH